MLTTTLKQIYTLSSTFLISLWLLSFVTIRYRYYLNMMSGLHKQLPMTIEDHHGTSSPTWIASNPLWTSPFGYQLASPRLCSVGSPSAVSCSTTSELMSGSTGGGDGGSGMYCPAAPALCVYNIHSASLYCEKHISHFHILTTSNPVITRKPSWRCQARAT